MLVAVIAAPILVIMIVQIAAFPLTIHRVAMVNEVRITNSY